MVRPRFCEMCIRRYSQIAVVKNQPLQLGNTSLYGPLRKVRYIKGQLGGPLTVYPWYLLCSLGILGDSNP